MTINSHYCESRWYLVLGGDALVSPLYNRDLRVLINRCKLTGPSFLTYMDIAETPSLENYTVKVLNGSKATTKVFDVVLSNIPTHNLTIPLSTS